MHNIHDVPYLESELKAQVGDVVEVVVHPSLGPPIDEEKVNVEATSRAAIISDTNR